MISSLLTAETLVYGALLFYVLGFLFRDELWLRGLLFIGTVFYILYYYFVSDSPLWEAIITSGILGVVNLFMIVIVVLERTTFAMGVDQAKLYAQFGNLSPGQFRRLMKHGEMITADADTILADEGKPLSKFYYVIEGSSKITKRGQTTVVPVGHFIGEVAFLKGTHASATVEISKGSRYVRWHHDALRGLMERSPNLSNGLIALLNLDMAGKVARSQPSEIEGRDTLPEL